MEIASNDFRGLLGKASAARFGGMAPGRPLLTDAITRLQAAKPRLIAVDMLLLDAKPDSDAALAVAEDPRQTLSFAAALWYGAQPETMVAVTGTNGKTSVASFTRQIWMALGLEAVNLGTTGVEGAWEAPLAHTTPDPLTLHRVLGESRILVLTRIFGLLLAAIAVQMIGDGITAYIQETF